MDRGSLTEIMKGRYGNKAFKSNGDLKREFVLKLLGQLKKTKRDIAIKRKIQFYLNTVKK